MKKPSKDLIYSVENLTEKQLKTFLDYMVKEDGNWNELEKESFLTECWPVYFNGECWEDYAGDREPVDARILFSEVEYLSEEDKQTEELFNIQEILEFQSKNDVQIIRGEDFQYGCYINKVCYYHALTPLNALIVGIKIYKDIN